MKDVLIVTELTRKGKPYLVFEYPRYGGYPSREELEQYAQVLKNTLDLSSAERAELAEDQAIFLKDLEEESYKADELSKPQKETCVYLMLNRRNGYYKIGESNNPKFREKTLQSEEPEIELQWWTNASLEDEDYLHWHFHSKRIRGEWFSLTLDDVEFIKSYFES